MRAAEALARDRHPSSPDLPARLFSCRSPAFDEAPEARGGLHFANMLLLFFMIHVFFGLFCFFLLSSHWKTGVVRED